MGVVGSHQLELSSLNTRSGERYLPKGYIPGRYYQISPLRLDNRRAERRLHGPADFVQLHRRMGVGLVAIELG